MAGNVGKRGSPDGQDALELRRWMTGNRRREYRQPDWRDRRGQERWGCKALVMAGGSVCLPRSKAPAPAFDAGARVKAAFRQVEGDKIVTDHGHGFKHTARDVQRGRSGEVDERTAALADAGSHGQNGRCA